MTLLLLLEMIIGAFGDRVGLGRRDGGLTYQQLYDRAGAGAELIRRTGARHLAYVGSSDEAFPVALFASAWAGVPFLPLNYRLGADALAALLAQHDDVARHRRRRRRRRCSPDVDATVLSVDEWNAATSEPADPEPSTDRRRGRRRPALHERHHRGAEGGRAAPPPPQLVRRRQRRVRRRRRRRRHPRQRAAVPRGRRGQRAVERLRRPAARLPAVVHAGGVAHHGAHRGDHQRHGRAHDAGPGRRPARRRRARHHPDAALAGLRRRPHADLGARAGAGRLPRHRLRERLRAHRDELHHRRPRSRGPPRTGNRLDSVGPAGARHRGRHPRRRDLGARRAGVGGVPRPRRRRRRRRLVPDRATAAGSTTTATCSSRAGPTTPSSAAARTSRPPRSRTCCSPTRRSPSAAVVGLPDDEWGQRIAAAVVLRPGTSVDEGDLQEWCRAALRSSKTPDVIAFRDELPDHRDRQAAAPRRAGRPARERRADGLRPRRPAGVPRPHRGRAGRGRGREPRHRLPPGVRRPDPRPGASRRPPTRRPTSR